MIDSSASKALTFSANGSQRGPWKRSCALSAVGYDGRMFHLALPVISWLASLSLQDPAHPILEFIPKDALAAVQFASADEFAVAFGELDAVFSPDDPSSSDDVLRNLLGFDLEPLRRDLPIVLTFSFVGQEPVPSFIIPVKDHDRFAECIKAFVPSGTAIKRSGAYAAFQRGGDYVPGGSKLVESWPTSSLDRPVFFARADMEAVETAFGPLIGLGLGVMESQLAEARVPEGSPMDMSAFAEIIREMLETLVSSGEQLDLAIGLEDGELHSSMSLLVRKGSDMDGMGSDRAPTYSNLAGVVSADSAIQIVGNIEDEQLPLWYEPMRELGAVMVPSTSSSRYNTEWLIKHAAEIGPAVALSIRPTEGGPVVAAAVEVAESSDNVFQQMLDAAKYHAEGRGAEVQTLEAITVDGVDVRRLATVEAEEPLGPTGAALPDLPDMTAHFARSEGRALIHLLPTEMAAATDQLAAQVARLKAPERAPDLMASAIKALGEANPAMAMTVDMSLRAEEKIRSGELEPKLAPRFEGPASLSIYGGITGRHWHGDFVIPMSVLETLSEMGGEMGGGR